MNKFLKKIGWRRGGLIIFLLIIIALYLNRSYAHIYNKIKEVDLKSSDNSQSYLVVNNNTASSSLTYVALGDSLTAGMGVTNYEESYPYLLAQYFAGNDYRINLQSRSYQGIKTAGLIKDYLPEAINDNPDIVTLLIGVNDIHGQISQKEFRQNYETILKRLTTETKAKIYVINIPFIGANNLLLPPYNYLFNLRTRQFNKIIKELADKYSVKYIDLYTPTEDLFRDNGPHYSADFFHPSAEGYKIWADLIYADISN
jgi:lysophospholipase L1-like esterase